MSKELFLTQIQGNRILVDHKNKPVLCPFRVPVLLPVASSRFSQGPPEFQINSPICSDDCIFHHLQETKNGAILKTTCTGSDQVFNVKEWK